MREHHVARLSWDEVGQRLKGGAIAVLPIGAGAKEHGLHMPMGTDLVQAEWLSGALAARLGENGIDTLQWPVLPYGYYPAFVAYAGSVSLSRAVFAEAVREIVTGLIGFGVKQTIVLDTGISTIAPIDEALAGLGQVLHLKIHAGPRYRAAHAKLCTQAHGSHADEAETSRMLVIAPGLVRMERAVASPLRPEGPKPGPLSPDDPSSPNYSPSGSFGDPTLATAKKGEALIAAMLEDMVEAVRDHAGRDAAIR